MKKESRRLHWSDPALVPETTETYCPIPHTELIRAIELELNRNGYSVLENHVNSAKDGDEIVGMMKLYKKGTDDTLPFCQMFGYMNSYNKRLPIKLASGAHVFICGNGMVVGEVFSYRKHTSGVSADLLAFIMNAVGSIEESFRRIMSDTIAMQSHKTTLPEEAGLLGRIFIEQRIINSEELNKAVAELRKPSFISFEPKNLWSLYNHLTFALKEAPPARRMDALKKLHDFFMEYLSPTWQDAVLAVTTD